ncbi:hypothetical protein BYT27DRAFT_7071727, partial [Phlegmacium glaucopus]
MNRPNGILEWARTHNCEFGIDKFQLLDLTKRTIPHTFIRNKRTPTPRTNFILGQHRIKSAETARFLGVIVDNKLSWKAQGAAALTKGQDWLIQFRRLIYKSHGISATMLRRLYLAIAVPRMLYTADIFLTPQCKVATSARGTRLNTSIITKLARIQHLAAIMITGALRTSPTDTLDAMANLLPFHLSTLRMATLPLNHSLHKPIKNAALRLVKRHPTPLHILFHMYKVIPTQIETINTVRQSSKWTPNFKIRIAESKDEAIEEEGKDEADVRIYTDGSGLDGRIGAGAVLFRGHQEKKAIYYYLGSNRKHTVYEGEGVGAIMGIRLL